MATWRRRAGKRAGLVLSLAFAALLIPIVTAEVWLGISKTLVVGERAPVTVRLPHVGAVPTGDSPAASRARIAVARGDRVSPEAARLTQVAQAYRHGKPGALTALFVAFSLIGILLTAYLRTLPRGAFLRTQITVLASLLVVAALSKAYLLLTPLS
ncbi:MAG: hypothetical protein HY698_01900, partial [Deltaproteobacteria bacterium]|nr:hypothetical protein [Deltaproteobacteria bacterium]